MITVRYFNTLVLGLLLSYSAISQAELYKWVDERGNTHYSDEPPKQAHPSTKVLALPPLNSLESKHISHSAQDTGSSQQTATPSKSEQRVSISKPSMRSDSTTSCFGSSPRATGESLNRVPLKASEKEAITELFQTMKGKWKGEATLVECKGDIATPLRETTNYETELNVKLRKSKELNLDFSMYSRDQGISKTEEINLFLSDEHISFSSNLSDKTVLLGSSDNSFTLWVNQFSVNSIQRELVRTFTLDKNTLKISQYSYSNGVLASSLSWTVLSY